MTNMGKKASKGRVVVAMSGGVDSSVAAYLIKKAGYETIGATMQIWSDFSCSEAKRTCCSSEDIDIARRVARQLDIPFYLVNLREEFEREVVEDFCREYLAGRTPNPCVQCNKELKFALLWNKAKGWGADWLATGHYARIEHVSDGDKERWFLKKGLDAKKDQSYFLFNLSSEELSRTLFPLGEYNKEEVREIAREICLKSAEKAESQEICFIPHGDVGRFIEERIGHPMKPGLIKKGGEILGNHRGLGRYTIGQRRGLGIATGSPLYVIEIDTETNSLLVGESEELESIGIIMEKSNISEKLPIKAAVKIRYNSKEVSAAISKTEDGNIKVLFDSPVRAAAPGQAAVISRGDKIIGGGWINSVIKV